MKLIQRMTFIILCVLLFYASANAEVVDKIIAIVNEDIITLSEFNAAFAPYMKRIDDSYTGNDKAGVVKQTRAALLQRIIDGILIEQEAKKPPMAIIIKDEEVMEVLKDSLNKRNMSIDDLLKNLARDGNNLDAIKKDLKEQLTRMRLLRREVRSKIMISDQEIGDYYNAHREEYEGKEAVRIKQILLLFPPKADADTREKLKLNAEKLRKLLLAGEAFESVAVKYSQGPAAAQGGDIGFIEKGVIVPEVETIAFRLPLENISEVIVSSVGLHIIKVIDKRGAGLKPLEAVRDEIKIKIEDDKMDKKYEEWIEALRKKAHIEIKL